MCRNEHILFVYFRARQFYDAIGTVGEFKATFLPADLRCCQGQATPVPTTIWSYLLLLILGLCRSTQRCSSVTSFRTTTKAIPERPDFEVSVPRAPPMVYQRPFPKTTQTNPPGSHFDANIPLVPSVAYEWPWGYIHLLRLGLRVQLCQIVKLGKQPVRHQSAR